MKMIFFTIIYFLSNFVYATDNLTGQVILNRNIDNVATGDISVLALVCVLLVCVLGIVFIIIRNRRRWENISLMVYQYVKKN